MKGAGPDGRLPTMEPAGAAGWDSQLASPAAAVPETIGRTTVNS